MTALPYSEATEGALIARLLVDPRPLTTLRLSPDDFAVGQYREAYRAMLALAAKHRPIDLVTLTDEGVDLVDALDSVALAHAPVEEYAAIVRRDAFRRRYINSMTGLADLAGREDDAGVLVTALHTETAALSEGVSLTNTLGRVSLADYQSTPPPPWLGVLAPMGTTILYGDGGDGKGWVAARLVSQLDKRVAIIDFETQVQEWGYRLGLFGVNLDDLMYFSPPTTFDKWATESTARLLRTEGVEYLVIDSAMYASDVEDPYSPAGALAYARARRRLNNLPALLLAHIAGGADKVFGSVFWKNEARITWRLYKDSLTRNRHIECKKANGYSWLEGTRYNILFDEGQGELELVQ